MACCAHPLVVVLGPCKPWGLLEPKSVVGRSYPPHLLWHLLGARLASLEWSHCPNCQKAGMVRAPAHRQSASHRVVG
jgi:hypothetical protein